jgi:hypothetical protein
MGIGRIFVGLSLKGSRVILVFKAIIFDLFRIRKVLSSIRWPVVILKNKRISNRFLKIFKIVKN